MKYMVTWGRRVFFADPGWTVHLKRAKTFDSKQSAMNLINELQLDPDLVYPITEDEATTIFVHMS